MVSEESDIGESCYEVPHENSLHIDKQIDLEQGTPYPHMQRLIDSTSVLFLLWLPKLLQDVWLMLNVIQSA